MGVGEVRILAVALNRFAAALRTQLSFHDHL